MWLETCQSMNKTLALYPFKSNKDRIQIEVVLQFENLFLAFMISSLLQLYNVNYIMSIINLLNNIRNITKSLEN